MGNTLISYGIALFVLGFLLLAYQLNRVYKRIRYRDTGDPQSQPPRGVKSYLIILAVIFIVVAQMFFLLSSQTTSFRPIGKDGFFARLKVNRTGDPIKTLEMKYIPAVGDSLGVENMFYLSGDSWRLKGEIINFKFANGFLGLPEKCYKTVEFNGRFLGRLPPRTKGALLHTETLEGGESGVFKLFRDTKLFSWFAVVDSFSTDYERVDNSVGLYMYFKPDGSVDLR